VLGSPEAYELIVGSVSKSVPSVSPTLAEGGFERLTKAKLLRSTSPGRYKTRQPGKFWTFPGRSKGMEPLLDRVRVYWDVMAKRRGGPFGERLELVRASSSVMRQYMNALHRAVDEANLAATHAKGEDTALFLIEGSVRRLLPF